MPIDILYVGCIAPLQRGGSGVLAVELLSGLTGLGHRVRALVPFPPDASTEFQRFVDDHATAVFQLDGPDGKRYPGLPGRDPGWGVPVLSKGPGMGADNEWVAIDLLGRAKTDVPGFDPEEIGSGYDSE